MLPGGHHFTEPGDSGMLGGVAQVDRLASTAHHRGDGAVLDVTARQSGDESQDRAKKGLPPVSLDEVRGWTEQMKALTAAVQKGNKEKLVTLTFQCRNVAGTQDDLVRDLSVVVIGVMEAAAEEGATSAKRAKLAEQIIIRCRRQLRHGTGLEPTRSHVLSYTPG
jgi:hypothetical protein